MTLSLVSSDYRRPLILGDFEPGSEEWHEARADKIGGSEIGVVCGVSTFNSPFRLYFQKLGQVAWDVDNDRMRVGRMDEHVVLARFAEDHPQFTVTGNTVTYQHPDRLWQLATPDGFIADETGMRAGLLEIKVTDQRDEWGEEGTAQIPPAYLAQVLQQLDVMGETRCWIAARLGLFDFRYYYVDLELMEEAQSDLLLMREAGEQFVDRLQNGPWPTPGDGSDQTYQAVRELHPEIDGTDHVFTDEERAHYLEACTIYAVAEYNLTEWKSVICDRMGAAQHAVTLTEGEDGKQTRSRFAYRTSKRKADGTKGKPYLMQDHKTKTSLHEALTERTQP